MHIDKKTIRHIFFVALGCIFAYWLLNETARFQAVWHFIGGLLSPFLFGAVLAFILNVPMREIEKRLTCIKPVGLRRTAAILLTFIVLILVVVAVVLLVIPQIGATVEILVPRITAFAQKVEEQFVAFLAANPNLMEMVSANIDLESLDLSGLIQKIMGVVGNSVSTIATSAVSVVGGITGALVDGVIGLVFALYGLARKDILARQGSVCCMRSCRSVSATRPSVFWP